MSAAVETSVDWALLEAEMPTVPCEHRTHGVPGWHPDLGPATHYFQGLCKACNHRSPMTAICSFWVASLLTQGGNFYCQSCDQKGTLIITTLQPIRATA